MESKEKRYNFHSNANGYATFYQGEQFGQIESNGSLLKFDLSVQTTQISPEGEQRAESGAGNQLQQKA